MALTLAYRHKMLMGQRLIAWQCPERRQQMSTPSWKQAGQAHRRTFIIGSDARVIMGNDEMALVRLWREKRGEAEPEDLSGNLIVQLGTATEPLNRAWYERNTG